MKRCKHSLRWSSAQSPVRVVCLGGVRLAHKKCSNPSPAAGSALIMIWIFNRPWTKNRIGYNF